jgi:hypothetical protein
VTTLAETIKEKLHKLQWRREMNECGYERASMTPQLSEALRAEIRTALEADGQPFDVTVARRVYDLAIAARDMCVAATGNVKEAIATIKDVNGPLESLDSPDTPESQVQASETFGARLLRELLAVVPAFTQQRQNPDDPRALVHALAEARRNGMTDVAKALEVKLLGRVLPGEKPVAEVDGIEVHGAEVEIDGVDVPVGSFEHGFYDGTKNKPRAYDTRDYATGWFRAQKERWHVRLLPPQCELTNQCLDIDDQKVCYGCERWLGEDRPEVTTKHAFAPRVTRRFRGPVMETCEHCGRDPRNGVHHSLDRQPTTAADVLKLDPPLCESCKADPDPRGGSACFACREIAREQRAAAPNPSSLTFDEYEKERTGKLTLDEAERLYKENLLGMP